MTAIMTAMMSTMPSVRQCCRIPVCMECKLPFVRSALQISSVFYKALSYCSRKGTDSRHLWNWLSVGAVNKFVKDWHARACRRLFSVYRAIQKHYTFKYDGRYCLPSPRRRRPSRLSIAYQALIRLETKTKNRCSRIGFFIRYDANHQNEKSKSCTSSTSVASSSAKHSLLPWVVV